MTRYNNWDEIPLKDQLKIASIFWNKNPSETFETNLVFIANGGLFQWAIDQGLINKPEPVKGWFVSESEVIGLTKKGALTYLSQNPIPLTYNPANGSFTKESGE